MQEPRAPATEQSERHWLTAAGPAAPRPGSRAALRRLAGPWWLVLLGGLVWLVLSAIVLRFTGQPAATVGVLLGAVFLLGASDQLLARAGCGLPSRRKLAGHAMAAALALFLTLLVAGLRSRLGLTADMFAFLAAVIAAALAGGLVPAVLEAVAGTLLLRSFAMPPRAMFTGAQISVAVLGVLVVVAVVAGFLAEDVPRRGQRAARAAEAAGPIAAADRMRTALLAPVSHDLHSPLASARAAVSCLRACDVRLTADDHDELLAVVDESLERLAHLTAGLPDVSRLQAGSLPVFPRPADLEEIITSSLGDFGPLARAVTVDVPCDLPDVMADPAIMERVVANLAGNALRYAPAGSPLLLTARARDDRVELRVIDRGPGIPGADRPRAFTPFQRLGDTGKVPGVGLGLAVSRGLTEAMGGTLRAEDTPGGGLTMAISLPAALGPARTRAGDLTGAEPFPHGDQARIQAGPSAADSARGSFTARLS